MGSNANKQVNDYASNYNIALSVLGAATAGAAFAASVTTETGQFWSRIGALALAGVVAVVGVCKVRNERAYKKQVAGAKHTLEQALKAEQRRIILLLNGALLDTSEKLKEIPLQSNKDIALGGFRTSVVNKVCELVQSDAPRAAYFKVEDPTSTLRAMSSTPDTASRNREDTFTSRFVEGVGSDQPVWSLIDTGSELSSNDLDTDVPVGWDAARQRSYKSFVSVPVRSGHMALGMLTANAMEKDGFTPSDIGTMKVLAHLLAAAEVAAMSSQKLNILNKPRSSESSEDPATIGSKDGDSDD